MFHGRCGIHQQIQNLNHTKQTHKKDIIPLILITALHYMSDKLKLSTLFMHMHYATTI